MNRRRLLILIGCVLFAAPVLAKGADKLGSANAIDFLKAYPVSKILPGITTVVHRKMPEIPLEKWLGSVMGDTPLEWESDSCSVYDSNIEGDGCASYLVTVHTPKGHCPYVALSFGVEKDDTAYLRFNGSGVMDFGVNRDLEQIADLEKTLKDVKAKAVPNRPSSLDIIDRMRARDILSHVRGLDVRRLDPSLPSGRFDMWIGYILGWSPHWSVSNVFYPCGFNKLEVYASSINTEGRGLPEDFTIEIKLGSWEEEIKGEPKLSIHFFGPRGGPYSPSKAENLSAFKNKIEAWKVEPRPKPMVSPKSVVPAHKLPVVQNMTKLGYFFRTVSTGHCSGHQVGLWKYGERVFGTHFEIDGQCADGREPTHIMRDVKYDSKTGELEFWSYGKPGKKFVGKIDQNMVTGEFLGSYEKETLKLKRDKNAGPLLDSDKNIEVWCKVYAPNLRYVVQEEVKELCASLGVQ